MATDVVVLFALEREARPFRRLCPRVPVAISGVGVERARLVARQAIDEFTPQRLILAGFGGALTSSANVGDVIVVRDVIDESGTVWPCAGDGTGRVLTVNRMIATVEEKLALGARFQAAVCDMESAAVAAICQAADVEFLTVRAISDAATRSLHSTLDRLIVNGQVSPRRAVLAVLREPRLIVEFHRLARDTRLAAKQLALRLRMLIES